MLLKLLLALLMALPRVETFGAGAGPLDSTWTQQRTSGTVNYDGSGNAVASVTASHLFAFDNANIYSPDQYAKITTGNMVAGDCYNQVSTRASGVGDANYQCYYVQANINKVEIIKVVAGVHTSLLDNPAAGTANGDVVELRSIGTKHEMFVNGVSKGSVVDTAIATGSAGIAIYDEVGGSVTTIAAWEGGDLASVVAYPSTRRAVARNGPYDPKGFLLSNFKRFDYTPSVVSSAFTLTPGTGDLTLTGFAPTIGTPVTVMPGVGSLALTGFAPQFPTTLLPGTGVLTLTGFAPTIGVPVTVAPGFGSLTLTGFAPAFPRTVTPGFGQLILTGFAPTFPQTLRPGVGDLTLSGFAPSFSFVAGSFTLQPGVGALTLTGFAPTFGRPITVVPGFGALTLTGLAPVLGIPVTVRPGLGQLTLTGFEPTLTFTVLMLARAIAQSVATDSLSSSSTATGTLIQNSGIVSITSSDSKTIQLITGNSGVSSIDSDG